MSLKYTVYNIMQVEGIHPYHRTDPPQTDPLISDDGTFSYMFHITIASGGNDLWQILAQFHTESTGCGCMLCDAPGIASSSS